MFALVLCLAPLFELVRETLFADGVRERFDFLRARVFDRLVNTIVLGVLATAIAALVAVPLAFLLHRRRFFGRRFLGILYVLPLALPPHIHCIGWLRVFGNTGWFTLWLKERGVAFDARAGFLEIGGEATIYPGAAFIMAMAFWPLMALLVSAGLSDLDPAHEEAALFARGGRSAARRIALRSILPQIVAGALLVFLAAIGCYAVPTLLNTPTIMQEIWFPSNNVDVRTAAVTASPLAALAVMVLYAVLKLVPTRGRAGSSRRAASECLVPRSRAAGVLAWSLFLFGAAVPTVHLAIKAGPPETYRGLFATNVAENVGNSLRFATFAAVLVAVVATLVGFFLMRFRERTARVVEAIVLLLFAVPAIIVGVAVNLFWSRFPSGGIVERWIYDGPGICALTYLALFLPFGLRAVRASLDRVPRSLLEAASLTANGVGTIRRRILAPLARPGIAAAAVFGFILTMGELPAGIIVSPGRFQTAQVRVFNMIHFARDEEVAALCLVLAALTLLPLAIYALLFNRRVEVL